MQLLKDNKYFLVAYAVFAAIAGIIIVSTEKGDFLLWWNANNTDIQTTLFKFLTRFGEVIAFLLAVLILIFHSYKNALIVAISGLVALPVVQFLKHFFAHPRPIKYFQNMGFGQLFERLEGVDWLTGSNSFPSGHTTAAFALVTALSLCMKNKSVAALWLIPAILTGFSRIYLRHHFLEDVFFGSVLGLFIAFLVYILINPKTIKIKNRVSILK